MTRISDDAFAQVNIGSAEDSAAEPIRKGQPYRILILGDFGGRRPEGKRDGWKPISVDRDNFEDVMDSLDVTVDLGVETLRFLELEDFHPDQLYARADLFKKVAAADKNRSKVTPVRPAAPPPPPPSAGGSLLDQVLEVQAPQPVETRVEDANDLAAFINRAMAGQTVKRPDAETQARAAERESGLSAVMREVLHHSRFQSIEAAWRGLFLLIRRLDTDGDLKIYILDATLPELIANVAPISETLKKMGRWALLAGNYEFAQSETHVAALLRLARMARELRAPFISSARPGKEPSESWTAFRKTSDARWVGLMLPRFLLRLPYGKDTQPVESFKFEEMPESEHNAYLWGNPCFAFALLLGQSFQNYGIEVGKRLDRRISDLPLHVYREGGEVISKPVAEVLMSEREAEKLLSAGFMPLASMKEQDSALIVRFQSVAQPAALLSGLQSK